MIRAIQIALLLAVIVPFAWAVKSGVSMLPRDLVMIGAGIPIGLGLSMLLDKWDARIRQRDGTGN